MSYTWMAGKVTDQQDSGVAPESFTVPSLQRQVARCRTEMFKHLLSFVYLAMNLCGAWLYSTLQYNSVPCRRRPSEEASVYRVHTYTWSALPLVFTNCFLLTKLFMIISDPRAYVVLVCKHTMTPYVMARSGQPSQRGITCGMQQCQLHSIVTLSSDWYHGTQPFFSVFFFFFFSFRRTACPKLQTLYPLHCCLPLGW
jgi:hypothetical protein